MGKTPARIFVGLSMHRHEDPVRVHVRPNQSRSRRSDALVEGELMLASRVACNAWIVAFILSYPQGTISRTPARVQLLSSASRAPPAM